MYKEAFAVYSGIILLLAFIVPALFFLYYQQKMFQLISIEHRLMRPGQVWLQLIPLFGLGWQFVVIGKLSDSIRSQLNTPVGNSLFADQFEVTHQPTYSIGIAYAVLLCCGVLPVMLVQGLVNLAAIICWIIYWVQLARYKKLLNERALQVGI